MTDSNTPSEPSDAPTQPAPTPDAPTPVFHHVGVYAYRPAALLDYPSWPMGKGFLTGTIDASTTSVPHATADW